MAADAPNIVLVGLPGVGKTSVGKAVARQLHRPFIDFDTEIEHRAHASIAEIFATRGESHFRELERSLTRELASCSGTVMSAGGGWITNEESVALLRPGARIIYLRVAPAAALIRLGVAPGRRRRPLLEGPDPLGAMTALYEARRPLYEAADFTVGTEVIDRKEVIEHVCRYALSLE